MNRRAPLLMATFAAFVGATVGMAIGWVEQYKWIADVNKALGLKGMGLGDLDAMVPPIFSAALLCAGVGLVVYLAAVTPRVRRLPRGALLPLVAVVVWLTVCAVGQSLGWSSAPWPGWFEVATTEYSTAAYGLWEMGGVLLTAAVATVLATFTHRAASKATGAPARGRAPAPGKRLAPAAPRGKRATSSRRGAPASRTTPAGRTAQPGGPAPRGQGMPRAAWLALALAAACLAGAALLGLPTAYLVVAALWCVAAWPLRGQGIGVTVAVAVSGALVQAGLVINSVDAAAALPQALLAALAPVPVCAWPLVARARRSAAARA